MTEVVEPLGGTTAGGLPYPVPTDQLAAGADAIRALAFALEDRGLGYRSIRGRVVGAQFTGGRPPLVDISAAGFTTVLGGLVVAEWNVSGSSPNPMTCSLETGTTTATRLGVVGFVPAGPGVAGGWYTGTLSFDYLLWGS